MHRSSLTLTARLAMATVAATLALFFAAASANAMAATPPSLVVQDAEDDQTEDEREFDTERDLTGSYVIAVLAVGGVIALIVAQRRRNRQHATDDGTAD